MNKFFLCSALFAASASADVYLQSFLDDQTIVAPDNDVYNAGDSVQRRPDPNVVMTAKDEPCPPGYGYITQDDCETWLGEPPKTTWPRSDWPYGCLRYDFGPFRRFYFNPGKGFSGEPSAPYGADSEVKSERVCRKGNQGGYPGDDRNGCYSGSCGGGAAPQAYDGAGTGVLDGWANDGPLLHAHHAHTGFDDTDCATCSVLHNAHGVPKMRMAWLHEHHPNGFTCQFDQTSKGGTDDSICNGAGSDCTCTCYCGGQGPDAGNNGQFRYNYYNQPDKSILYGDMSATVNGPDIDREDSFTP